MSITLFTARELVTLDEDSERANAVAVLDGRILYVGTTESVTARLGDTQFTLDTQFADAVLVPGFIEAHISGWASMIACEPTAPLTVAAPLLTK